MSIRRRRSQRSGRAPLRSLGRPPVAERSELQRFWLGIAQGMTSEEAALAAGMSQPVGTRMFRKAGGAGEEQNAALARAVIGGLLFATPTTLLIVPYLFAMLRKGNDGVAAHGVFEDLPDE
jgi:hypothetical protein